MKVEHMGCLRMIWRGCQEVAFKQEGLEKITVGIAQLEAGLNQTAELFERSPHLGHFSAKLIGKVFNALLNRGFEQLVFVVKIEINRALSDFGLFSYTVDGGSLEAVLSNPRQAASRISRTRNSRRRSSFLPVAEFLVI